MPPNFSTTTRYGIRFGSDTPTPNIISDFAAIQTAMASDIDSRLQAIPPRVTALPTVGPSGSGPLLDGQECYFVADATNGVIWHLRYNAASGSAHKWEFVGGAQLRSQNGSAGTSGSSSTAAPVNGSTTLTLPLAGDYEIKYAAGAHISGGGANSTANIFLDPTSLVALLLSDQISITAVAQQSGFTQEVVTVNAGAVVSLAYLVLNTGTVHFDTIQRMSARPVRVH